MKKMKALTALYLAASIVCSQALPMVLAKEEYGPEFAAEKIVEGYVNSAMTDDVNALWFAADINAYSKLFPNTECGFSAEATEKFIDYLIPLAQTAESPAELSKCIITLRSFGYDAKNIIASDGNKTDLVNKLTLLINSDDKRVESIYTLPYVLIALQQGKDYMDSETKDKLLNMLLTQKEAWQDTMWGTDTAAPVMIALSPYYNNNEKVDEAVNETIDIIKKEQSDSGLISNAASTGLVITAFSSLGINPENIKYEDNSLIDGLMSEVNEAFDGFLPMTNSFSTEQGLRGIVSWMLYKNGKKLYDFSDKEYKTAVEGSKDKCTVIFDTNPEKATVHIDGFQSVTDNIFLLANGAYNYSVACEGYKTKSGALEISQRDISEKQKNIFVTLEKTGSQGLNDIKITLKIMTHNADECNGIYTYKNNKSEYTPILSYSGYAQSGQTVFDLLDFILNEKGIDYTEKSYAYISSIDGIDEFSHGESSGWMFTVNGSVPDKGCKDYVINEKTDIVWFFTDNFADEFGSEKWAPKGGSLSKKISDEKNDVKNDNGNLKSQDITATFGLSGKNPDIKYNSVLYPDMTFNDINENNYIHEITELAKRGIINGVDGLSYEPDRNMTRAEFAAIVVRALGFDLSDKKCFDDVNEKDWFYRYVNTAYSYGIVKGVSEKEFLPYDKITRAEAVVMLSRAASLCAIDTEYEKNAVRNAISQFTDYINIPDWATEAFAAAIINELIPSDMTELKPYNIIDRNEIAFMIYNMLERAELL